MNWGTKILLGMGIFMLFIITLVVFMFAKHGNDALVEEDYYEKGISYNATYDAEQNVLSEDAKPVVSVNQKQLIVALKDSANYNLILLRPSNKSEDLSFEGNTITTGNLILIDRSKLAKGAWFLNLKWKNGNKEYLYKTTITL